MTQSIGAHHIVHSNYIKDAPGQEQPKYNIEQGKKTKGEKFVDFNNYFTVGYAINLALSVAVTEFFLHRGGKDVYHTVDNFFTKHLSKITTPEKAKSISKVSTTYSLLTSGGTLLMLPMLWAENNKAKLVYLSNRQFSPEQLDPNDPYKDLSAKEILSKDFEEKNLPQPVDEQPKNGVANGTWRRMFSIALVLGWANMLNKTVGASVFEDVGLKAIKSAENENKYLKKFSQTLDSNPKVNRWTRWTITDIVNTAITTGAIWATSGAKSTKAELPADVAAGIKGEEQLTAATEKQSQAQPVQQSIQESAPTQRNDTPMPQLAPEKIHANQSMQKEQHGATQLAI